MHVYRNISHDRKPLQLPVTFSHGKYDAHNTRKRETCISLKGFLSRKVFGSKIGEVTHRENYIIRSNIICTLDMILIR
jgi:hypothetical protein